MIFVSVIEISKIYTKGIRVYILQTTLRRDKMKMYNKFFSSKFYFNSFRHFP